MPQTSASVSEFKELKKTEKRIACFYLAAKTGVFLFFARLYNFYRETMSATIALLLEDVTSSERSE